jgi:hypothetical protein
MTRILFSILAGSLATAAAVIAADTKTGVMFLAGGICLLILQAALLSDSRRARSLARFIEGVCDSMENLRPRSPRSPVRRDGPVSGLTTEAEDLKSALVNLGMNPRKAHIASAQAARNGGTLSEMIRRATANA